MAPGPGHAGFDRAAQMQVRNSLNRQVYVNPNTGQRIETSDQHTHSSVNPTASVVLNGDPTFEWHGGSGPPELTELIPVN